MIHVGDDALGLRVEIPIFHTGCFAQSGTGKTKLTKYMIKQVIDERFTVVIFDSKVTGPEFTGIGTELPFYLEQSTDPDVFRSLLEGMRTKEKGNLERFRGGFIDICEGTADFADIGDRLKAKLADTKIKGFTRDMYKQIDYDYRRLMKLLGEQKFGTDDDITHRVLKSPGKIFTFPTWKLPNLALQGLVVRSVVELLLRVGNRIIVLVDEAPNFVSQRRYNPAKSALELLDAQGRSDEIFGWYTGQTLTGFDKANMKNLWYWIMGREMERNEVKDVFETQTEKVATKDEIKKLKVREFIVSTPDWAKRVTVPHVDEEKLFPKDEIQEEVVRDHSLDSIGPEDWSAEDARLRKLEEMLK